MRHTERQLNRLSKDKRDQYDRHKFMLDQAREGYNLIVIKEAAKQKEENPEAGHADIWQLTTKALSEYPEDEYFLEEMQDHTVAMEDLIFPRLDEGAREMAKQKRQFWLFSILICLVIAMTASIMIWPDTVSKVDTLLVQIVTGVLAVLAIGGNYWFEAKQHTPVKDKENDRD